MTSPGKAKGNTYERELVKQFQAAGFEAKRAWGSNGQSLGHHEEVDVLVNYGTKQLKVQAKRRKKLPTFLGLTEHVDVAVFRQDNDESFVLMRLDDFLQRIK
jgi:Holliday junction resolvase